MERKVKEALAAPQRGFYAPPRKNVDVGSYTRPFGRCRLLWLPPVPDEAARPPSRSARAVLSSSFGRAFGVQFRSADRSFHGFDQPFLGSFNLFHYFVLVVRSVISTFEIPLYSGNSSSRSMVSSVRSICCA